jgi:hypothetical protein
MYELGYIEGGWLLEKEMNEYTDTVTGSKVL